MNLTLATAIMVASAFAPKPALSQIRTSVIPGQSTTTSEKPTPTAAS